MPGTIPKLMNAVWYEANGDAADVLVHGEMPVPVSMNAAGELLASIECCEGWEDLQRVCSERVDRKEHPPTT